MRKVCLFTIFLFMKKLLLFALFVLTLWVFSSVSAEGSNPIPGIDIIIKSVNCIDCDYSEEVEIETLAWSTTLWLGAIIAVGAVDCKECFLGPDPDYDVEDETTAGPLALWLGAIIAVWAVNLETDEDAIVDCKITKVDESNIECEVIKIIDHKDEIDVLAAWFYRCEDGTVIESGESCPPIIMKAQAIKIDGIEGEVPEDTNYDYDNVVKQWWNTPVEGIDIIIKEAWVTSPSTLYRCEDGKVVEDSTDCGSQIGMVKYMKIEGSDGLDRVQESLTVANITHICDDGTLVSLPSECDDTSEYDTIVYVPADDFHQIEKKYRGGWKVDVHDIAITKSWTGSTWGGAWKATFKELTVKHNVNSPCTGPEDESVGCDGVSKEEYARSWTGWLDRLTENVSIKTSSKETRQQEKRKLFKVKDTTVEKYKKNYGKKLERVLPQLPEEKLEEILERIDTMLEKTENNSKLSDKKKEALFSAVLSIRELIEDQLTAIQE